MGRVRRAMVAALLGLALAGCATFPDEGPRDWRDKLEGAGELGGPPVVPEPTEPGAPLRRALHRAAARAPSGCEDPDPQVVATCLEPVGAIAVLPDARVGARRRARHRARAAGATRPGTPARHDRRGGRERGRRAHRARALPRLRRGPARLRLRHDAAGQPGGPDRGGRAAQARADRDPARRHAQRRGAGRGRRRRAAGGHGRRGRRRRRAGIARRQAAAHRHPRPPGHPQPRPRVARAQRRAARARRDLHRPRRRHHLGDRPHRGPGRAAPGRARPAARAGLDAGRTGRGWRGAWPSPGSSRWRRPAPRRCTCCAPAENGAFTGNPETMLAGSYGRLAAAAPRPGRAAVAGHGQQGTAASRCPATTA